MPPLFRAALGSFLAAALVIAVPALCQSVDSLIRITVNGPGAGANDDSNAAEVSSNAPLIVFASLASNLAASDTNNASDIFLRNTLLGTTRRLSIASDGTEANGGSFNPAITAVSPRGAGAVVFASDATNLAESPAHPDTNGVRDIYIHLLATGRTERVTFGPGLVEADGASRFASAVLIPEPDRIAIAYASAAANLVPGDTNEVDDIFLTTVIPRPGPESFLENGLTNVLVSRAFDGGPANGGSSGPRISGDGSRVVFASDATNLVPGPAVTGRQIYLYEIESGEISLVSRAADGTPGNADSERPFIDYRGNTIVYATEATNIVGDGAAVLPGAVQILRFDGRSGTTTRVNVAPDGTPGNGVDPMLVAVAVDPSGRVTAFSDEATNLVANDQNGVADTFVADFETGSVLRVSESIAGAEANLPSFSPFLARNRFNSPVVRAFFSTRAGNLVPGDNEGNIDIFRSAINLPPRVLTDDTVPDVPPDATVTGDDVLLELEEFSGAALGASRTRGTGAARRAAFSLGVRYTITASREGERGKKRDLRKIVTRRSSVTFKNLKSGTYIAKYRAEITRKRRRNGKLVTKIVSRTPFSPGQRISRDD